MRARSCPLPADGDATRTRCTFTRTLVSAGAAAAAVFYLLARRGVCLKTNLHGSLLMIIIVPADVTSEVTYRQTS